jgi:hypothetical protein
LLVPSSRFAFNLYSKSVLYCQSLAWRILGPSHTCFAALGWLQVMLASMRCLLLVFFMHLRNLVSVCCFGLQKRATGGPACLLHSSSSSSCYPIKP